MRPQSSPPFLCSSPSRSIFFGLVVREAVFHVFFSCQRRHFVCVESVIRSLLIRRHRREKEFHLTQGIKSDCHLNIREALQNFLSFRLMKQHCSTLLVVIGRVGFLFTFFSHCSRGSARCRWLMCIKMNALKMHWFGRPRNHLNHPQSKAASVSTSYVKVVKQRNKCVHSKNQHVSQKQNHIADQ